MRKYILDFYFDEITGNSNIIVDFQDESMTAFEMNDAVRSGEIREELLALVEKMFGSQIAADVRCDKTQMICLDDHPEEKKQVQMENTQEQSAPQRKENLL